MEPIVLVRAFALVVAGYLIGGIPWGVIVARLSGGPDPRTIGSGRTGGANTMRALGPRLALLAGLLDMLKGTAAALLAWAIGAGVLVQVLAALAAVIGHSRSPFLGFGGGRGVARTTPPVPGRRRPRPRGPPTRRSPGPEPRARRPPEPPRR